MTGSAPRGDRILYLLSIGDEGASNIWHSEVWTVAADGSNPTQIFSSKACSGIMKQTQDTLPVWSPDGTQIGYRSCGSWVVVDADRTSPARLVRGVAPPELVVPLVLRSWAGGGLTDWDLELIGQRDH